jgi:hypothetical protein
MQQKIRSIMTFPVILNRKGRFGSYGESHYKGKIFYQKSDKCTGNTYSGTFGFVVKGDGIMINRADGQPFPTEQQPYFSGR